MSSPSLLPSLAHALSGSAGTAISTIATYPLDLVNTRLKVQRQLSPPPTPPYRGVLDALSRIYAAEGGARALFAGLRADAAKSVADSFLFFLFYEWFRARRLHGRRRRLNAAEELAVGAVAGAAARFFTQPVGNVVARRQTAGIGGGRDGDGGNGLGEVLREIAGEKGWRGLWAGYSASLVLTLNPSVTFFLQQTLTKKVMKSEAWDSEERAGAGLTFVLAAVSKVIATGLTYPFQIAKARVQVLGPETETRKEGEGEEGVRLSEKTERLANASREGLLSEKTEELAEKAKARIPPKKSTETIFGTVARIRREEGVGALYDGLAGELIKAFFSHGITMVGKDAVHALLVRLYGAFVAYLSSHPKVLMALLRLKFAVVEMREGLSLDSVKERTAQVWGRRTEVAQTAQKAAESALSSGKEAAQAVTAAAGSALNSSEGVVDNVKTAAGSALSSGGSALSNVLEDGQRKLSGK